MAVAAVTTAVTAVVTVVTAAAVPAPETAETTAAGMTVTAVTAIFTQPTSKCFLLTKYLCKLNLLENLIGDDGHPDRARAPSPTAVSGACGSARRGGARGPRSRARGLRARASRSACMRRAPLPFRRCFFSQAAQHLRRRDQRELLDLQPLQAVAD